MTLSPTDKTGKTDKTPAAPPAIWLHHDPAIARLEVIAWLAYPSADRAAKAFNRLTWWPAATRGQTVPEKPSRLEERLGAIDVRLRHRLLAGSLYAAKDRRYVRSQPPWNEVHWPSETAAIESMLRSLMDAAQPPGTQELLRRLADVTAAGDRTWFRKLTAESRPVAHLATAWVNHSSVRPVVTLWELAFGVRPAGEVVAIIRNAESLRTRIAADPSNNVAADAMLRFAQRPAPLAN